MSSKTGENVKEVNCRIIKLFEKLSKLVYKKYNSSSSFRELVTPEVVPGKAQSFNIESPLKKSRHESNCC